MNLSRSPVAIVGAIFALTVLTPSAVLAHPMTHQGTVLAIEPARIQVNTVDDKTKKEEKVWFVVNKDTKVKRGEKIVTYADAKIAVGERIVVIVDMDAKTKNLVEEIRLAAR
jgi:hypothetical protein